MLASTARKRDRRRATRDDSPVVDVLDTPVPGHLLVLMSRLERPRRNAPEEGEASA
ncbi:MULTISPECIES: hypothetical protein [Methylobacterium]|uniref:hypothetical protein n=1 Tax=Methylobacterium TaxID=407 RepID=UPI000EF09600|nr:MULTISPECIES: hypothetical protein [Methylobacterium]GBU17194.1 hypothetical protein AwMethylo_14090 [Methylobacterium sp.]